MAVINRKRRSFLKAAGVCVALPALESLAAAEPPAEGAQRLVCVGGYLGFHQESIFPKQAGRDYEISPLLEPIAKHRDDFTIFSGLDHNLGGGHNSTKYFLSGIPVTQTKGYTEANISVDQKAAQFVGGKTRYSSLVLGCENAVCRTARRSTPLANPATFMRKLTPGR